MKKKKWACMYCYDEPCVAHFTVEAETHMEAEGIVQKALKDGKFVTVTGENESMGLCEGTEHVFVVGEAPPTIEELIAQSF